MPLRDKFLDRAMHVDNLSLIGGVTRGKLEIKPVGNTWRECQDSGECECISLTYSRRAELHKGNACRQAEYGTRERSPVSGHSARYRTVCRRHEHTRSRDQCSNVT